MHIVSLHPGAYMGFLAIILLGGGGPSDGSHPGRSSNIPSNFRLRKQNLSASLMGHLAHK